MLKIASLETALSVIDMLREDLTETKAERDVCREALMDMRRETAFLIREASAVRRSDMPPLMWQAITQAKQALSGG